MTQKATIIDSGPHEPEKPGEFATDEDKARYVRDQREFEAWHKQNPEPVQVEMYSVDADEAVRNDPRRYTKVALAPHPVNVSIEDRVARLEAWVAAAEADLTPEDREARTKRRAEAAERIRKEQIDQAAEQKAEAVRKRDADPEQPPPPDTPPLREKNPYGEYDTGEVPQPPPSPPPPVPPDEQPMRRRPNK